MAIVTGLFRSFLSGSFFSFRLVGRKSSLGLMTLGVSSCLALGGLSESDLWFKKLGLFQRI